MKPVNGAHCGAATGEQLPAWLQVENSAVGGALAVDAQPRHEKMRSHVYFITFANKVQVKAEANGDRDAMGRATWSLFCSEAKILPFDG